MAVHMSKVSARPGKAWEGPMFLIPIKCETLGKQERKV